MSENTTCPTCGREDFKSELGVKFHHTDVHGESLSEETFTCDYCDDEFTAPKHSRQEEHTFCDQDCSSSWMSENVVGENNKQYNRIDVSCDNCGNTIQVKPNRTKVYHNHFCDNDCKYEWLSEYLTGESNPKYNMEEYVCENCGEKFNSIPAHRPEENKFCGRDCQAEWQRTITGEDHPHYRGGHSGGFTQSERDEIFQRDNYTCQECGNDESPIHAHHIIPVHENDDKAHNVENGKALCVECHAEKHPKIEELILGQKD